MPAYLSQSAGLRMRATATAHLAQTMTLIALPAAELEAAVASELSSNPALEISPELRCPNCGRRLRTTPCPVCARESAGGLGDDGPIVYLSSRTRGSRDFSFDGDDDGREAPEPAAPEKLAEHVLRQIAPMLPADDRQIAAYLLTRLDERGFLPERPVESAVFLRVPVARVESVLSFIQHADPPGLGAQDSRESLLLQLESLAEIGPVHPLARICLAEHWDSLGRRDLGRIARALQVSREEIVAADSFIRRNLIPYPAQSFWGDGRGRPSVDAGSTFNGQPDALISLPVDGQEGPLRVEVFTPVDGWLRVDPNFKAAVSGCTDEERDAWERYTARAQLFAKCLRQRNNTMCRLMESIAREQKPFIVGGDRDLKPMTRASLAERLGVHESTISRAVAHKSVALPDGRVVPLAKFFDRSLSVRDALKEIVHAEVRPLTDDEIAVRLAGLGYAVARRTVAKYRAAEGILPALARARVHANGRRPG